MEKDTGENINNKNPEETKVFVVGSTGGVGLWTAHYLLDKGYKVSTMVRN